MNCRGGGGGRLADSSSACWPPLRTLSSSQLRLLLLLVGFSVETQAALIPMKPLQSPGMPRWFYNGTHASSMCETTFRCDTSKRNDSLPSCSCHQNCSLFDACCEDMRPSDWRRRSLPRDAYECTVYPVFTSDAKAENLTLHTAEFVFLITKCPRSYKVSAIINLCSKERNSVRLSNESLQEQWVTESTTGITYSNQFCAACNGVKADRMISWNVYNTCITDPGLGSLGLTGCQHSTPSSSIVNIPKCTGPYYASCPNDGPQQMQDACVSSPSKYIYDATNFVTYRNYNCTLCNTLSTLGKPECKPYTVYTNSAKPFQGLQALLAFDTCPKRVTTYASKDDQAAFNEVCPDTVFDTPNCSETLNKTALLSSYGGDDTWEYSITSEGVQIWLNDTYSICYACQPYITNNYTLLRDSLTTADGTTYVRPLFQFEDDGSVTVCSLSKPVQDWLMPIPCSDLPDLVDVVLMSLSLLGLAMYAVAYSVLPSLRNLPGQIVLHQSAALFAAFLLWLLRTQAPSRSEACIALGVLIHYFFLAAFTWTTVYAFEVVRALGFQAYGAGYTKRRMRYTLAGWLVPLVITIIAIVVNWAPAGKFDSKYRPAYGSPQCFISSWISQRIFFTAPLAAFLFIDVMIYAYVIVQLVVISGQTKLVRENHHEKLLLAVKLVFALGITWIFAVLASATENCDLAYIFRVLNSLQGVFLFLIFICNAKTSGQIHQRVRGQKSLTSGITTGVTVSTRDSSSSTTGILSKRKSVLGVKSFSPVSLAMDARERESKPPHR